MNCGPPTGSQWPQCLTTAVFRGAITPGSPASPGWTARPPSGTLEPVTAPAGARAAHLSPATPARDHPQRPRRPSFAGTPRRQDPATLLKMEIFELSRTDIILNVDADKILAPERVRGRSSRAGAGW